LEDFATNTGVCVAGVPNVKMDFVQIVKNTEYIERYPESYHDTNI
jgi:hypothetical protein